MKLDIKSEEIEIEKGNATNSVQALSIIYKQKARRKGWIWQITLLSLALSALFAVISELMLSHTNLILALLLILILVAISVLFDIIGMAVTAGNVKPLLENKSRGVRGAEVAVWLVKNADKVSSICTDVIGDICSILSGAAGVAISIIIVSNTPSIGSFFISILISSLIASINVLAKAIGKTYAIRCADIILLKIGKFLSIIKNKKKN